MIGSLPMGPVSTSAGSGAGSSGCAVLRSGRGGAGGGGSAATDGTGAASAAASTTRAAAMRPALTRRREAYSTAPVSRRVKVLLSSIPRFGVEHCHAAQHVDSAGELVVLGGTKDISLDRERLLVLGRLGPRR